MARYLGSTSKMSRRLGVAIVPKDQKYLDRRPKPPGQRSNQGRRGKVSEYGIQLKEKQKMKFIYGVLEKQFRTYYKKASAQRGITGENLVKILERRLDNTVYRAGFATSRPAARQLVSHGHLLINKKKVNIPSYQLKPGDVIEFRKKSQNLESVESALSQVIESKQSPWMQLDKPGRKIIFTNIPERGDVYEPFNERLVVELYSK